MADFNYMGYPFRIALQQVLRGLGDLPEEWIARLDTPKLLSDREHLDLSDAVSLACSGSPWTGESMLDAAVLLADRAIENANIQLDVRSPYPTWIIAGG